MERWKRERRSYELRVMGRRIDVVLIIQSVVFVLEFKVGAKDFSANAIDQVFDYALDLKNFHETSHPLVIAPILIATQATKSELVPKFTSHNDKVIVPLECGSGSLIKAIDSVLKFVGNGTIDVPKWEGGRYRPTPTIIEAARAL